MMRFATGGGFPQTVIVGCLAFEHVSVVETWTKNQPADKQGQQRQADKQACLHLPNLSMRLIKIAIYFTGNIDQ